MAYLLIKVEGHLLVAGGHETSGDVHLPTMQRLVDGQMTPYIPASSLRGCIRHQLERLLAGIGEKVASLYPFGREIEPAVDKVALAEEPDDVTSNLFGYSGNKREQRNSRHGRLRFSDALPLDVAAARAALAVKPGVTIDRLRGTAENQKLFFKSVVNGGAEPTLFWATCDFTDSVTDDQRNYVKVAAETTWAIGAGKGSGGGAVTIQWFEDKATLLAEANKAGPAGAEWRLVAKSDQEHSIDLNPSHEVCRVTVELLEPAHYGDGGALANHHATLAHIPGATLRGGLAWALIRDGGIDPDKDAAFQATFVNPRTRASFGEALPRVRGKPGEIRAITLKPNRVKGEKDIKDYCLPFIARELINEALARNGSGRVLKTDFNGYRPDSLPARDASSVLRRGRTRLSIDRTRGTAQQGVVFSKEYIEPFFIDEGSNASPATFDAEIRGPRPEHMALLHKLKGVTVYLGSGRGHGHGKVRLTLKSEPAGDSVSKWLKDMNAIDNLIREYLKKLPPGLVDPSIVPLGQGETVLTLMAVTEFMPPDDGSSGPDKNGDRPHPLADTGLIPWRCLTQSARRGGYDQRPAQTKTGAIHQRPLRHAIGPGSLFFYKAPRADLQAALKQIGPSLFNGIGGETQFGFGRFTVYLPQTKERTS